MPLLVNGPGRLLGGGRRTRWWELPGQTCLAAYEPQGAASLAASYINLANPGTYDAAPGAAGPTWNAADGWVFDAAQSQYLTTGLLLPDTQEPSIVVWFTDLAGTGGCLFGMTGTRYLYIAPAFTGSYAYYAHGGSVITTAKLLRNGAMAVAGAQGFRFSLAEAGAFADSGTYQGKQMYIGCINGGSPRYVAAKIRRIAVYATTLAQADLRALLARRPAMRAGQFVTYGDSITQGLYTSDDAHRWANVVAAAKGWSLQNSGIAGTVLQNTVQNTATPLGAALSNNGRDTLEVRVRNYIPQYVAILYGFNDMRFADPAFSVENFANDLGEVVDGITVTGLPADNIVIGSPPYFRADMYTGSVAPWNACSHEKHMAYIAATRSVALAKGTRFADVYAAMAAGGGDSLLNADGIHPNDAGHAVIANAFLAAL